MSDSLAVRGVARRRSRRVRGWVATAGAAWALSCLAIFFASLAATRPASSPGRPLLLGHASTQSLGQMLQIVPWSNN